MKKRWMRRTALFAAFMLLFPGLISASQHGEPENGAEEYIAESFLTESRMGGTEHELTGEGGHASEEDGFAEHEQLPELPAQDDHGYEQVPELPAQDDHGYEQVPELPAQDDHGYEQVPELPAQDDRGYEQVLELPAQDDHGNEHGQEPPAHDPVHEEDAGLYGSLTEDESSDPDDSAGTEGPDGDLPDAFSDGEPEMLLPDGEPEAPVPLFSWDHDESGAAALTETAAASDHSSLEGTAAESGAEDVLDAGEPVPVTVSADDKWKLVGDLDPELTATVEGELPEGVTQDMFSFEVKRETGEEAGKYEITVSGDTEQHGCAITFEPSYLVISGEVELALQIDWQDESNYDQIRPGAVYVTLRDALGRAVGSEQAVTGDMTDNTGWTVSMSFPALDGEGNRIDYSGWYWEEEGAAYGLGVPVGYERYSEPDIESSENRILTIIRNFHTPQKAGNVTARKICVEWDDDGNKLGLRPKSITFGLNSGQKATLSEANGWTATVTDLPVYYKGTRYVYQWTVFPSVPKYAPVSSDEDILFGEGEDSDRVIGEVLTLKYECLREEVTVIPKARTLTIRYYYRINGRTSQAREPFSGVYEAGSRYYEKTPAIAGYTPSQWEVSGTMPDSSKTVTVYYTPNTYTLLIRYRFVSGAEAAKPYSAKLRTGQSYRVVSPSVNGFRAGKRVYEGKMPARNVSYVVYYYPVRPSGDGGNGSEGTESGDSGSGTLHGEGGGSGTGGSSSGGGQTGTGGSASPGRGDNSGSLQLTGTPPTRAESEREIVIEDYDRVLGEGVGETAAAAGECFE